MESGEFWYDKIQTDLVGQLNGRYPTQKQSQEEAYSKFLKKGWPKKSLEAWKYTSFEELQNWSLRRAVKTQAPVRDLVTYEEADYCGVVFLVNGFFDPLNSKLPEGLEVRCERAPFDGSGWLKSKEALTQLNYAFAQDVVLIRVGRNVQIESPLQVVYISVDPADTAIFPRVQVDLEQSSALNIVERYIYGAGADRYFTCSTIAFRLAENASLNHIKIQQEARGATHWQQMLVTLNRSARAKSVNYAFGGRLVRNEIVADLNGEGSTLDLFGLTLAEHQQHVDNSTEIIHSRPHCESHEVYKGIYADEASGAFSGSIIVEPHAQKTNAIQSNQGLLLSDKAVFNTRPQLKIWADDVKCTHGATVGQLDEEALFYLRARGIPRKQAMGLLTQAFAEEIIERIAFETLREQVLERVQSGLTAIWDRSA